MGKEQYVVLKQCYKRRRNRYYYKVVFKVDADNPNALDLCWDFINKDKCEFQYSIVRTYWVGTAYMHEWQSKEIK